MRHFLHHSTQKLKPAFSQRWEVHRRHGDGDVSEEGKRRREKLRLGRREIWKKIARMLCVQVVLRNLLSEGYQWKKVEATEWIFIPDCEKSAPLLMCILTHRLLYNERRWFQRLHRKSHWTKKGGLYISGSKILRSAGSLPHPACKSHMNTTFAYLVHKSYKGTIEVEETNCTWRSNCVMKQA